MIAGGIGLSSDKNSGNVTVKCNQTIKFFGVFIPYSTLPLSLRTINLEIVFYTKSDGQSIFLSVPVPRVPLKLRVEPVHWANLVWIVSVCLSNLSNHEIMRIIHEVPFNSMIRILHKIWNVFISNGILMRMNCVLVTRMDWLKSPLHRHEIWSWWMLITELTVRVTGTCQVYIFIILYFCDLNFVIIFIYPSIFLKHVI